MIPGLPLDCLVCFATVLDARMCAIHARLHPIPPLGTLRDAQLSAVVILSLPVRDSQYEQERHGGHRLDHTRDFGNLALSVADTLSDAAGVKALAPLRASNALARPERQSLS